MNIYQIFAQTLGRNPTTEEADYFQGMLDRGEIKPVEFMYFLQGTPEVQQQSLQQLASQGQARRTAESYDIATFPKYREQIISRYAKMGRPATTAIDVAMAKQMGQLALERGQQFAGMSRQDILSNIGYGRETAATGRQQEWQSSEAVKNYERQLAYQAKQNEYNVALAKLQRKWTEEDQPSFLESLIPGVISAGGSVLGGYLSKPTYKNYYGW